MEQQTIATIAAFCVAGGLLVNVALWFIRTPRQESDAIVSRLTKVESDIHTLEKLFNTSEAKHLGRAERFDSLLETNTSALKDLTKEFRSFWEKFHEGVYDRRKPS